MRKMARMLLVAILGAVMLPFAAHAQQADTPALREAEDLQRIARDPHHLVTLHLGDGAPFKEHRELFDHAFAACRQTLRATSNDNAVRANLGGLYLWRNALHPEESGNFEKAIDQFLIVLSNDPGNGAVLEYLRTYEVLVRVRTELGEQGMTNIESALQHTLKDPPGAANLRAFARVHFFDGRLIEARAAAEALTELSPEPDSYLLLGSIELKMAHADKALTAFQVAQQRARDALETATAKLGAAEANQALGHTDNADHLLAEAIASLPAQTLEHGARVAGLDTPAELGWAIGKSYMASGEIGKAAEHLGTEGIGYLLSEMASAKNSEGVKLFDESKIQRRRESHSSPLLSLFPWSRFTGGTPAWLRSKWGVIRKAWWHSANRRPWRRWMGTGFLAWACLTPSLATTGMPRLLLKKRRGIFLKTHRMPIGPWTLPMHPAAGMRPQPLGRACTTAAAKCPATTGTTFLSTFAEA